MAGGRLYVPAHTDADLQIAFDARVRRFLMVSGRPVTAGVPLIDTSATSGGHLHGVERGR